MALSEQPPVDLVQVFKTIIWGKFCAVLQRSRVSSERAGSNMCAKQSRLIPAGEGAPSLKGQREWGCSELWRELWEILSPSSQSVGLVS